MPPSRRPSMHRALLLALLVLSFAPVASAHAVPADFLVEPFAEPIPFEGERSTTILFDYRCSGMSTAESEPNMTLRLSILRAPAWATLRVEPADIPLAECRGVGQARALLVGSADRSAAGLGDTLALVQAEWLTSGFSLNSTAQVALKVPFVAAFDVEAPITEQTAKPQSVVVFPITITSRATGIMKLTFEVVEKTGGVQVPMPNPITLQGPDGIQRSANVPITFQTPYKNGFVDDDATVTMRITPAHALDPRIKGEPQEIVFRVKTEGFYAPGPQFFGVLAALAIATFLAGRRRSAR